MVRKALVLALNVLFLSCAGSVSFAQDYPSRTVTFVVPFAAGSVTDSVARFVAERFNKALKVPIVVENKPGGNGVIAARAIVSGATDGYTIFITTNSTHAANVNLYKNLPYDPVNDFAPVSRIMQIPLVVVVRPDLPADSLEGLMQLAAAKSGEMSYASGNTSSQVAAELIARAAKAKFTRVPYTGNNKAIVDVMESRVDILVADMATALPQIEGKKVKALAVTSAVRVKQLPNVPTVAEAGVANFEVIGWLAAFVKANTPPDIVSKLNAAFVETINSKEAEVFFNNNGGQPFASTPTELRDYVVSETAKWANFVEVGGIEKQ